MNEGRGLERWIAETIHEQEGLAFSLRADEVLVEERTEHQHLILFRNRRFGKVLVLDGAVQLTEADEFVYHEMMAHVPALAHGAAKDVLIVGGGDGGIAREVLRHSSVEALTMVEIDAGVVEFSREHLPEVSGGAFDDPRFELVIADGAKFVAEAEDRFDVVIVDSTDPVGPAQVLYSPQFYADCRRALRKGGVLVTQSGSPLLQGGELTGCIRGFRQAGFADATCYLAATPTYFGGFFALGWASDDPALARVGKASLAARRASAELGTTRYYTPGVHEGAFALPPYIQKLVDAGDNG